MKQNWLKRTGWVQYLWQQNGFVNKLSTIRTQISMPYLLHFKEINTATKDFWKYNNSIKKRPGYVEITWGDSYQCHVIDIWLVNHLSGRFWLFVPKFWKAVGNYQYFFAQKWIQPEWWRQCFFKKCLGEHRSPFCWVTDTPILNFSWHILWVSKPQWAALFVFGRCVYVTCSLKFTSSMTPADLMVASMATEPFSSTYLQVGNGGTQNLGSLMPATHSVRPGRQMLYQLSYGTPDPYFLLKEKFCTLRQ